jgi:hypothetical protein
VLARRYALSVRKNRCLARWRLRNRWRGETISERRAIQLHCLPDDKLGALKRRNLLQSDMPEMGDEGRLPHLSGGGKTLVAG